MIRRPGLLAADLSETARLEPTAASLTLKMIGAGEAALTLAEDAPTVHVHDWVSMYTGQGLAGIFRVTNVAQTYRRQIEVSLLHGIDILSDSVWAAQTTFTGTKAAFLAELLNQQTQLINGVKPWQLGRCEDSGSIERDINYDRLSTLLEALEVEGSNYYFVYDQTTWPWTIHYVAKANAVSSEFRLTRNIRTATVTYNDADLCTRLYLSVSSKNEDTVTVKKANPNYISDEATPGVPALVDTNITVSSTDSAVRTYDNTAAQAVWGIVVKTADIDTHDDIQEQHFPSADAWAANYLALRAEPSVQIQIDGDTLRELTGNEWDESDIGALCQVALPEYGHTFREYVVTVTYPDLVRDESHVTISLANTLPKVSESIAMARSEAKTAARASRATARTAADAKEVTSWSQIVQYHGEALDGSGVLTLYESGISMDATGGVKIYSLEEGVQGLYSGIQVNSREIEAQSRKISLIITGDNNLDVGSIVGSINDQTGQSIWRISADMVELNAGTVLATTLDARLANVDALFTTTGYTGTLTTTKIKTSSLEIADGENGYHKFIEKGFYVGSTLQSTRFLGYDGGAETLKVPNAVTGFGTATSDQSTGEITIPFYTFDAPSTSPASGNKINFNMANMAFFQNHVGISSLVVDVTDQAGYNDSTADPVSVAADGYYIIAATPKYGTATYKKFHVPAGSATVPKVSKSEWQNGSTTFTAGTSGESSIPVSLSIVPTTNWSAATVPVNPTFRIDDGQSSTGLTGTFRLQVENDYVYVKSNTDNPVIGTNVLARQANGAYSAGQQSVSATLRGTTTQTTYTTLEPGYYGLYRTIDSTVESTAVGYYRVTSGGTSGVKYVVSSSGDPITIWDGLSIVGNLYPNTDVITGGTDQLNRIQVTYRGRTGYVGSSYISTTKGATNYIGRIGWTDEGSDASTRSVTALSNVILSASDTGTSSHNVNVTYDDGTTVQNGATVTIDASAIAGGGGGANLGHRRFTTNNTYYATDYGLDGFSSVEVAVSGGSSGSGGVSGVSKYAESDDSTDFVDWTLNATKSQSKKYAFYKIAANDGSTYNFGVDASDVYIAGQQSGGGSNRTVSSLSSITLSSSDIGTSSKNTTVTYTTGSNSTASISINASRVYQQGVSDGYDITTSEISAGSFSVQTGSTSGRTSAGSISGQSVYNARNSGYIFFSATCRGKTRNFYISINA